MRLNFTTRDWLWFFVVMALTIIGTLGMGYFVIAPIFGICPQGPGLCNANIM